MQSTAKKKEKELPRTRYNMQNIKNAIYAVCRKQIKILTLHSKIKIKGFTTKEKRGL